ncbi:hypothetical protein EON80_24705, partial [bacterium]
MNERQGVGAAIPCLLSLLPCLAMLGTAALGQVESPNTALLAFKREQVAMMQDELARPSIYRTDDLKDALGKTQGRIA